MIYEVTNVVREVLWPHDKWNGSCLLSKSPPKSMRDSCETLLSLIFPGGVVNAFFMRELTSAKRIEHYWIVPIRPSWHESQTENYFFGLLRGPYSSVDNSVKMIIDIRPQWILQATGFPHHSVKWCSLINNSRTSPLGLTLRNSGTLIALL